MIDADKLKEELKMFGYDIARTTLHLFAVLRGLELVRNEQRSLYAQLGSAAHQGSPRFPLKPSALDAEFLVLGHDPLDELHPDGAIEQFAYQAWVVKIVSRWEHERRPQSRAALGPGVSSPEMDVMGDLRHIRNDLVHAHGRATKDHCGKCKVLRWFEPEEQMTLRLAHVLDFIHQSGFLEPMSVATSDGDRMFLWGGGTPDVLRGRRPVPKIVSLRTEPIPHHNTNELWAGVSVVYDNGFKG